MRQKFYDSYYRSLDLEPGASLEDIDRMWHLLVQVWHPDRLPQGSAVYHHAVRRMQDINVARDELRAYFNSYGQPPPVESTNSQSSGTASQSYSRANTQQQQQSARDGRNPRSGAPPPPPPPPPPPSPSHTTFDGTDSQQNDIPAPKPFEKTWVHHFYDWMDKNSGEDNPGLAIVFGFALLIGSFGLARLIVMPFWPMEHEFTNQDSMAIFVIAFIIYGLLFRLMWASYEVYKLLEKPFFEAVPLPPAQAYNRILEALKTTAFENQLWSIVEPAPPSATTNGAQVITAKMFISEATVTLNARIWPSNKEDWSVIGLEFDADHPWRIPAPYACVRVTNQAIVSSLK